MNKSFAPRPLLLLAGLAALVSLAGIVVHFHDQRSAGRSAAEWSIKLSYGTAQERETAQAALRQLGGRAVPSLCRALHATDPPYRNFLFRVANHSPDRVRSWIVQKFLYADGIARRALAAQALAFIGQPAAAAAPELEAALRQGDQRVAAQAAAALASFGPAGFAALFPNLEHPNPIVRQAVIYGLALARTNATPAVPALRRALSDTNEAIRAAAAYALTRIWTLPATGLVALVEQETGLAREAAAKALQDFRTPSRLAQPPLLRMLASPFPGDRSQAIQSLAYLQPWNPEVFSALIATLTDSDQSVRAAATNALSPVNQRARASLGMLAQNLTNPLPEMRAWSARVLGNFGTNSAAALPALALLAADADAVVRAAAADATARILPAPPPPPN